MGPARRWRGFRMGYTKPSSSHAAWLGQRDIVHVFDLDAEQYSQYRFAGHTTRLV